MELNTAYIDFIREDKSKYPTASSAGYYDPDNDFLIGQSGGFLMNMNFIVIDTIKFSKTARFFETTGRYIDAPKDSSVYTQFYQEERDKRKHGITENCKLLYTDIEAYNNSPKSQREKYLKPLHITGDHYNFLNYARINKIKEIDPRNPKSAKKGVGFPRFFISQYWLSKIRAFCKNNGFNLVIGKSRRGGFSFYMGASSANSLNLDPDYKAVMSAYDKKYVTKSNAVAPMTRTNIEWYELKTDGLFKRGIFKRDIEDYQLGFATKEGDRDPDGWNSTMFCVSFGPNNPAAAIGKDAQDVFIEELNDTPNLSAFLGVTEPTTRTGSFRTGFITGWGTAGSKEGNWETFEAWYYNPKSWGAMPFENVWDKDSRDSTCGLFKPYWENLEGILDGEYAMDEHGNPNYEVAMKLSDDERTEEKKNKTLSEYIVYCGQYANYPSEMFTAGVENMFSSPELDAHINDLKHNPDWRFYMDGQIVNLDGAFTFKSNKQLEIEGTKIHPYLDNYPLPPDSDFYGAWRIWYHPVRIDGLVPKDLYRATYDPVGISKDKDDITDKDSKCSITIRMIPNKIVSYYIPPSGLIVARFFGRRESLEADDLNFLAGLEYYNAIGLVETSRGNTYENFMLWKKLRLLAHDPLNLLKTNFEIDTPTKYGMNLSTTEQKLNGLVYLKNTLYTPVGKTNDGKTRYVLHYIPDLPMCLQIQKFHPKKNLDIISDLILQMYDNKAVVIQNIKATVKDAKSNAFYQKLISADRYN